MILIDCFRYVITAERVANVGRINVRKARPVYDSPDYHRWSVGESPAGASSLDLAQEDLLHVGRTSVEGSEVKFTGVLARLSLGGKRVGLWDFVSTLGSCREAHGAHWSGGSGRGCYSFGGAGYAVQRDLPNYDPRHLSVSLEFRTFDENALILLIASDDRVSSDACSIN